MGKIYKNMVELIGRTPILHAGNYEKFIQSQAHIFTKLEYFNPAGSVKDRIAASMIEEAEKSGRLKKNSVIIEPTSGNTGIALAAIATAKGYKIILTMPETMSMERRNLLKAYGAELVLTDGTKGMKGAIEKAEELLKKTPNGFMPSQFENPANPAIHRATTAPEIWDDMDGKIDIFIAGVGTGGSITGVGEYLKAKNPKIQIIAIEPASSPVLSKGTAGAHKIQGIGAGFVPKVLNTKIYDEVMTITDEEAVSAAREFGKTEGVLVGISSGAVLHATKVVARSAGNKGKNIISLLPDTGERYLSTILFAQ